VNTTHYLSLENKNRFLKICSGDSWGTRTIIPSTLSKGEAGRLWSQLFFAKLLKGFLGNAIKRFSDLGSASLTVTAYNSGLFHDLAFGLVTRMHFGRLAPEELACVIAGDGISRLISHSAIYGREDPEEKLPETFCQKHGKHHLAKTLGQNGNHGRDRQHHLQMKELASPIHPYMLY
jgi:hypothetical protein